jgi:DNA-binding HxlR family transcriptional regulator
MDVDSTPFPVRVRTGGTVLSLLAGPLCAPILRAHLDGPLRLPDLRERIGGAAQTTLRGQVGNLRAIGALERHVRSGMPYTVENELTDAGRGILGVADMVEAWLSRAPQGPIAFGSEPAKGAIRALVAGWGSTILRALASRPLSLTELDGVVPDLSYPALERRLSAMRAARQVEALPSSAGGAKPYAVTDWTRQAVGLLVAAGRCECEHFAGSTEALTRIDIEAAFLLAVPLVDLPVGTGGSCVLAVGGDAGKDPLGRLTGVGIQIDRGEVVSCMSRFEPGHETRATGSVESWVGAILEGGIDGLALEGPNAELARTVVEAMHLALA